MKKCKHESHQFFMRGKYNVEQDSYYCPKCKEWLEKICGSKDCAYCRGRSENAKNLEKKDE